MDAQPETVPPEPADPVAGPGPSAFVDGYMAGYGNGYAAGYDDGRADCMEADYEAALTFAPADLLFLGVGFAALALPIGVLLARRERAWKLPWS